MKKLYRHTEILMLFRSARDGEKIDERLLNTAHVKEFVSLGGYSELDQPKEMEFFLQQIPKFPMELMLDELGEVRIALAFSSVFEAAYFVLARFVSVGCDMHLQDGDKTPLAVCDSCGKIFIKKGNRQKYCDETECLKERNRCKARQYNEKMRQIDAADDMKKTTGASKHGSDRRPDSPDSRPRPAGSHPQRSRPDEQAEKVWSGV